MGQIIDFNELKDKKKIKKYILYLIFAMIILYTLFSIYLLVKTPNDTVTITNEVLTLEEASTGYIIREETVLKGENYKNGLTSIIAEGERAAKGQTVFRYSGLEEEETKKKIEEINEKIQEALTNQTNLIPTADIKNLEKQIDEISENLIKTSDISAISEYKKNIQEIVSKKAKIIGTLGKSGEYLKELTEEKEEYENKLTEDSEYIIAPEAGLVSYRVDGLEEVLTTSDFSTITKETLESLDVKTGKIVSASTESGKIINNFNCFIATVLNSEAAKDIKVGNSIKITLSSGNELSANIKYKTEEENDVLLILELKNLPTELIEYRKISFNITWWNISGLRVPNSSIIEEGDGKQYVIRRKSGQDQKLLVKVLNKNEKYSIIGNYNEEELNNLGIKMEDYTKIAQYDTILVYPTK